MSRRALESLSLGLRLALAGLGPFAGLARPVQAQTGGTSYTSPTFGYSLTYDASWTVPGKAPSHNADTLFLSDGVSAVVVTAGKSFKTPRHDMLDTCLQSALAELGVAGAPGSG